MLRKMTKTTKGASDGIHVIEYKLGHVYDLPEKLALVFDGMGVCSVPEPMQKEVSPVVKVKAIKGAPNNKMVETPADKEAVEIEEEVAEEGKSKTVKRRRS